MLYSFFLLFLLIQVEANSYLNVSVQTIHGPRATNVMVYWDGIQSPSPDDKVGIFTVPDQHSFDYREVTETNTWNAGYGSILLMLPNYRRSYRLKYYHAPTKTFVASSDVITTSNYPLFGRLALTSNSDEMLVAWNTRLQGTPVVMVGPSPGVYEHEFNGTSTTFGANSFKRCMRSSVFSRTERERIVRVQGKQVRNKAQVQIKEELKNFISPGYIHSVTITNLLPGKRYYYKYGMRGQDSGADIFATESSFIVAPNATPFHPDAHLGDAGDNEVQLLVTADWGSGTCEKAPHLMPVCTKESPRDVCSSLTGNVIKKCKDYQGRSIRMGGTPPAQVTAKKLSELLQSTPATTPSALIVAGDVSYARGRLDMWDAFLAMVEPLSRQIPFMVSLGNHEYKILSGGECGVPFTTHFRMPWHNPSLPYYHFTLGPVFVVVVSTEHIDGRNLVAQQLWLDRILSNADRNIYPWIVVSGHKPMYTSGKVTAFTQPVSKMIRQGLEPTFIKYNVSLAIFGHVHSYERSCPMADRFCAEGGVTHVTAGTGGHGLHPWPRTGGIPNWSTKRGTSYGFMKIRASYSTLTADFVTDTEKDRDVFRLKR